MHFMKNCLKGARSSSRRRWNDLHFPAIALVASNACHAFQVRSLFRSPPGLSLVQQEPRQSAAGHQQWVSWNHSQGDDDQIVCTLLVLIDKDQSHPPRDVDGLTSFPHSPSFMVGTRISRLLSMPMRRKSCAAYRTLFCTSLSLTYWLISCQIYSHSHSYSHLHTC